MGTVGYVGQVVFAYDFFRCVRTKAESGDYFVDLPCADLRCPDLRCPDLRCDSLFLFS